MELGREIGGDADLIYASLVPYEAAGPAIELAQELAKPLVLDLQDPWALDEMMVYPSALHRRRAIGQMRRALGAATAVVMNTPESRARVLAHFPELRTKVVESITNGFDQADFEKPAPARHDAKFRIVHTGYLHTELGQENRRRGILRRILGGGATDVDILTRSHVYVIEAIEQLRTQEPEIGSRIELHLAGVLTDADRAVGQRSPAVHMLGYLPHDETVSLMRSADLLFLPMHDVPRGKRVGIVPGKTYEYLASQTPILAAVPDGDISDILREAGNAFICAPADVDAMKSVLREQVARVVAGEPPPTLQPDVLARFERRRLSEALASLFDTVVGQSRESLPRERVPNPTAASSGRRAPETAANTRVGPGD